MPEDDQVWQDELEMMVTQEVLANAMNDESRQAFEEEKRKIASQKKAAQATVTNQLSTYRTFVSTGRPFVSTDSLMIITLNLCCPVHRLMRVYGIAKVALTHVKWGRGGG
ncbi:hypothetical protein Tco_0366002 [Tanacetum coccineum]